MGKYRLSPNRHQKEFLAPLPRRIFNTYQVPNQKSHLLTIYIIFHLPLFFLTPYSLKFAVLFTSLFPFAIFLSDLFLVFRLQGSGISFSFSPCSVRSLEFRGRESGSCPSLFLARLARGGWERCVHLGLPMTTHRQCPAAPAFGVLNLAGLSQTSSWACTSSRVRAPGHRDDTSPTYL